MNQAAFVLLCAIALISVSEVECFRRKTVHHGSSYPKVLKRTPARFLRLLETRVHGVNGILDLESINIDQIERSMDTVMEAGYSLKVTMKKHLDRIHESMKLMQDAANRDGGNLMNVWANAQTALVESMTSLQPLMANFTSSVMGLPRFLATPPQKQPRSMHWKLYNGLTFKILQLVQTDRMRGFCVKSLCDNCKHARRCIEGRWNITCVCQPGFRGKWCDQEFDECATIQCENGGECKKRGRSGYCQCPPNFAGPTCAQDMRSCSMAPCQNGGSCIQNSTGIFCLCKKGFEGINCEVDIDDCFDDPCENGGTCLDGANTFTCMCPVGWGGRNCTVPMDPCAMNPCQNKGSCIRQKKGFYCSCAPGFAGKFCQTDVNQCNSSPCLNGATCNNLGFNYSCTCMPGYAGANCENNINVCAKAECQNGATCVNGVGSFTCICPPGFSGTMCEKFVDQCASNPCKNHGRCMDMLKDYKCLCKEGFNGTNCETNIDDCASNPCTNGATCLDGIASFMCKCSPGFEGATCSDQVDYCGSNPCQNKAACVNTRTGFQCNCQPGYFGLQCQEGVQCRRLPASDNYNVTITNKQKYPSSATFNCAPGFFSAEPMTLNCRPDGSWDGSPPNCNPVRCAPINTIDAPHSVVTATNGGFFPSTATYIPHKGYTTRDVVTRDCKSDGSWAGITPTFIGMVCETLAAPQNGEVMTNNSNTFPAAAFYTCSPGYKSNDPLVRYCQPDGKFSGSAPKCEAIVCEDLTLTISNGRVQTTNDNRYPSVATYTCEKGYATSDATTRQCQSDGTWTSRAPICDGMVCAPLPPFPGGSFEVTNKGRFPSSVNYKCLPGYVLQGPDVRQCESSGTWTGEDPKCLGIRCDALPPRFPGGIISTSNDNRYPSDATYRCMPGYTMSGSPSRTCQVNGKWDGDEPTCVPIKCQELKGINNGTSVVSNGGDYPATATFQCDVGFTLSGPATISCTPSGAWDRALPSCSPMKCLPLDNPLNGVVNVTNDFFFPSTASYTCNRGYTINGAPSRMCNKDGSWSGMVPNCEEINECLAQPCRNGATCVDKIADYECKCATTGPLYNGKDCDIPLNFLSVGQRLEPGSWLSSADGQYELRQMADGRLKVVRKIGESVLWVNSYEVDPTATSTPQFWSVLQADGNLVTYKLQRGRTEPVWSSATTIPTTFRSKIESLQAVLLDSGALQIQIRAKSGTPTSEVDALTQFDSRKTKGCFLLSGTC